MNFRNILISAGCFAAAIGFGSGKAVRANDIQAGNDSVSSESAASDSAGASGVPCAIGGVRNEQPDGCERIDGRVRIDAVARIPDPVRFGGRLASPVAVRSDEGTGPRGHLYLPGTLDDLEPVRR
jgi:hypothetical protein